MTVEGRYSRQELLLGKEGQRRLQDVRVAIVGIGGLGSHVVQQLAYLGVLAYVVVDGDVVTPSSLNRLIGAVEVDVAARRPKVEVAQRVIQTVQPKADVRAIGSKLEEVGATSTIADADLVFGCLDDDLARLRLLEHCAETGKPYVDLASDTDEDGGHPWYGGRMVFSFVGKGCLSCRGVLDQRALARATMTARQREEDDRSYGVSGRALAATGPSVVSVNGVVASLGVTEFMAWATDLREPWPELTYRGDRGRVSLSTDPPIPDCYYCTQAAHAAQPTARTGVVMARGGRRPSGSSTGWGAGGLGCSPLYR